MPKDKKAKHYYFPEDLNPECAEHLKTLKRLQSLPTTEGRCVEIGDALCKLRICTDGPLFHRILQDLPLTPLAARRFESISRNGILKSKLSGSKRASCVSWLSRLAGLPDDRLKLMLQSDSRDLPEDDYQSSVADHVLREMAIHDAICYGWPKVEVRPGEVWMLEIVPAKIGAGGTVYLRIGLHTEAKQPLVCPRTTDPALGGRPTAACSLCDMDGGIAPVPYWAMYCLVFQVSDDQGHLLYLHPFDEPWLLVVNESLLTSVLQHSKAGNESLNLVYLFADETGEYKFTPFGPTEVTNDLQQYANYLTEPAELLVDKEFKLPSHLENW